MTMIPKTSSVDEYTAHVPKDMRPLFDHLRNTLLDMGLDEEIKWRMPVYSAHGRNAMWLGSFKLGISLSFFEGNRIEDYLDVLINVQEGKTEAMRHWRFHSIDEVNDDQIRAYIGQAIDIAADPIKKVKVKKETIVPPLLEQALKKDGTLRTAFESLTPFKQREFCEHIETAKRDATKQSRLNKIVPMILAGIGLGDKYRK